MSDTAIRIEQLAKQYHHAPGARRHATLRDRLSHAVRPSKWGTGNVGERSGDDGFWALRDVSFEVAAGEVLGVLGHNGSGKSTLLKILARITEPTAGSALVRGRVGALLEIGTGFHMELSGRENVFLSGAILGMRRHEIRAKFDAIIALAGIERFLEMPVKRYSSGMYLRLAFAVAAHLERDVLLLDEVLSVGDAAFQRECQTTIRSLARAGRAILLVSHDWEMMRLMCDRAVLLAGGRVQGVGGTAELIRQATAA